MKKVTPMPRKNTRPKRKKDKKKKVNKTKVQLPNVDYSIPAHGLTDEFIKDFKRRLRRFPEKIPKEQESYVLSADDLPTKSCKYLVLRTSSGHEFYLAYEIIEFSITLKEFLKCELLKFIKEEDFFGPHRTQAVERNLEDPVEIAPNNYLASEWDNYLRMREEACSFDWVSRFIETSVYSGHDNSMSDLPSSIPEGSESFLVNKSEEGDMVDALSVASEQKNSVHNDDENSIEEKGVENQERLEAIIVPDELVNGFPDIGFASYWAKRIKIEPRARMPQKVFIRLAQSKVGQILDQMIYASGQQVSFLETSGEIPIVPLQEIQVPQHSDGDIKTQNKEDEQSEYEKWRAIMSLIEARKMDPEFQKRIKENQKLNIPLTLIDRVCDESLNILERTPLGHLVIDLKYSNRAVYTVCRYLTFLNGISSPIAPETLSSSYDVIVKELEFLNVMEDKKYSKGRSEAKMRMTEIISSPLKVFLNEQCEDWRIKGPEFLYELCLIFDYLKIL
ncbi:hypothetical protein ACOME3_003917 [Neoechinorhynchus agilis]